MRRIDHLNEKNKEKPLCFPYSMKARTLLHAHFDRMHKDLHKTLLHGKFISITFSPHFETRCCV